MTYGQNKKIFMALCDEYAPDNEFFTDDEDIQEKCALLYGLVYPELNQYAKTKTREITVTEGNGFQKEKISNNFYKIKSITCMDSDYNEADGTYKIIGDYMYLNNTDEYTYTIEYIPLLTAITEDTTDDFELELDDDASDCLPLMVANELFKTDPGQDYRPFQETLQRKLQLLSTTRASMSANVTEGVFD